MTVSAHSMVAHGVNGVDGVNGTNGFHETHAKPVNHLPHDNVHFDAGVQPKRYEIAGARVTELA